jgi:cell division protein ZipA
MEDELRLFLLLGGTVFIIGVLAHGIWKIRKNSKPEQKTRLEPRQWQEDMSDDDTDNESDDQGFDELGLGEVRVVSRSDHSDSEQVNLAASDGPDMLLKVQKRKVTSVLRRSTAMIVIKTMHRPMIPLKR